MVDSVDKIIENLDPQERVVFEYFRRNVSVGEILAVKELKLIYKLEDPLRVIDSLIRKGLLEKGVGCINLAASVRDILKKRV
jgi:ribosome maturation protein Sdo1